MLRLFRARACCLITALVLAAGTANAALAELLHEGSTHDAACVSGADVTHDAGSHRIRSASDDVDTHEHCVGCHLARAPRIRAEATSNVPHTDDGSRLRPIAVIGSARAAALDSLPPRSPPRLA